MTELLVQNSKISNSSKGRYLMYNFGIPAYKSSTGLVTCPAAGKCKHGCYAAQGAYVWPVVAAAYEYRLAVTRSPEFCTEMIQAINRKVKLAERKRKQLVIRIHDSGDFYSPKYLTDWLHIIDNFPQVLFYAYTKQVALLRRSMADRLRNFVYILSEGGKLDQLIGPNMRHSRVFNSLAELRKAGYDNATKNDSVAFTSKSGKIGLVYHGAKSKNWSTT